MLASPLPSTDVKSDQTFSAEATIQQQQQHFATAATRRTSYSLYHHSTHEPDVYPEFNWEAHSTTHLSNMGDPLRSQSDDVDSKSHNSPLASALELHQTTGSASPQSSGSETLNSDGGTASLEMCLVRQAPHDASRTEEPLRVSNKRPRPSFSQLDRRCFERYRYAPEHSRSLSPSSADEKSLAPKKENDDDIIQAPAAPLDRHKHDSTAIDALDNSSLRRPHGGIPSSLQSSSDVASFPVEHYISHPSSTHGTPATPHSATPISFSSHQSQPQHLHFSGHSHGYLSAVPSPLVPHSNGNDQSGVRSSYPGSPLMTLTAPNSATFPQEPNSSFSPLASQLHSAANQSQLGSPPSIHHRTPDAAYSQASASRVIRPYPSNGATQDVNAQILPGVPPSRLTASPAPQSAQASPWSSVETQAPRRRGKLPSAVTAILKGWLMAHTTHPYPTEEEKKSLCLETNLTMNQVSNWFINARRRILVPPSAGNSVHEVRQPIRRQAQSQLPHHHIYPTLAQALIPTIRSLTTQPMETITTAKGFPSAAPLARSVHALVNGLTQPNSRGNLQPPRASLLTGLKVLCLTIRQLNPIRAILPVTLPPRRHYRRRIFVIIYKRPAPLLQPPSGSTSSFTAANPRL
ncbi:hypothetical protein KEM48_000421 [Puccinia striiformis f. sp. tritici PST-130]|nr:hypothetical protein KEM48_000421 [Puccinia striiformis f. sp. tritici PST-130]